LDYGNLAANNPNTEYFNFDLLKPKGPPTVSKKKSFDAFNPIASSPTNNRYSVILESSPKLDKKPEEPSIKLKDVRQMLKHSLS
jgi:hypothetical protein